jgi:hypothetical protein
MRHNVKVHLWNKLSRKLGPENQKLKVSYWRFVWEDHTRLQTPAYNNEIHMEDSVCCQCCN